MAESGPELLRSLLQDLGSGAGGPAMLERVAGLASRAFTELSRQSAVVRFLRPHPRDQIVLRGEPFELVCQVGAARSLLAEHVRFWIGEEAVGDAPVMGGAAWLVTRFDGIGIHEVHAEIVGRGAALLRREPVTRLQVVDERPLLLIDAALAQQDPHRLGEVLARLDRAGLGAGFIEIEETADKLERVLPYPGAVLSRGSTPFDFGLFGVDSRMVFLTTTVRRLRASGVAVVGVVADLAPPPALSDVESLSLLALADHALDPRWIASLVERADALHVRREAQDAYSYRLDEATGTRALEGNRCRVELDNRLAREAILAAVDTAAQSIDLQVYILEDGAFVDRLGAHLVLAAERGVRVRLLVDALYSREQALGLKNPILEVLRAVPGIDVRANDPVVIDEGFALQALRKRDHRKLAIFDERRAFVSGRNAGDLYYTGFEEVAITDYTPYERIPWLDAHLELQGPLVGEVHAAFAEAWTRNGGETLPPIAKVAPVGSARARLILHESVEDANGMAAYEAMFDAARDHIYVLNDFPIVSHLVAAVRRAILRGVRVRLLTGNGLPRRGDGSFFRGPAYRELFEHLTKGRLEPLIRMGLEVYEYATDPALPLIVCAKGVVRPYVHAKLVTADGRVLSVGSANLDATASFWEREANVVVEDEEVVGEVERWLEEAIARSYPVDVESEHWRSEARVRTLVNRVLPEGDFS